MKISDIEAIDHLVAKKTEELEIRQTQLLNLPDFPYSGLTKLKYEIKRDWLQREIKRLEDEIKTLENKR